MKFSYAITVAKRAEQKRILSFIHLADYMIANALHRILIDSMQDMLRILAPPKPPPKVLNVPSFAGAGVLTLVHFCMVRVEGC